MTERVWPRLLDAALRVLAACVGTLPAAVLASVCLARFLPLAEATRLTLGFMLAIPLWLVAVCFVVLSRSGRRAWGACLAAALLLGLLAYGCSAEAKLSGRHHETSAVAAKRAQVGVGET